MHLGSSPFLSHDSTIWRALFDQSDVSRLKNSLIFGSSFGRLRKRWREVRTSGLHPVNLQRGLTRSIAFNSLPHLSHWSPRASSYPHSDKGHVPIGQRSKEAHGSY